MTAEEIEKQILRQLRMNGLVNSQLDIINHLDREIRKESDVIHAIKDGYVQESRSSVASTGGFEDLRRFWNRKLKEAGQDILKNVELNPVSRRTGLPAITVLTMRCAATPRRRDMDTGD